SLSEHPLWPCDCNRNQGDISEEDEYSVPRMSVEITPKDLNGEWDAGSALDVQTLESTYVGDNEYGRPLFDTKRSALGELLYQLKYHNDNAAVAPIIETLAAFLNGWKIPCDVIIP